MTTLTKAHTQWATRPNDERFDSLESLHAFCETQFAVSREKEVPVRDVRVEAVDGAVMLVGRAGVPASLTHWAFSQLATRIGAPGDYLRGLPATLAAQNVNHGLARITRESEDSRKSDAFNLLLQTEPVRPASTVPSSESIFRDAPPVAAPQHSGELTLRSAMTPAYSRLWNRDVTARLLSLPDAGWSPRVVTPGKANGLDEESTALYASDRDMFAFLVNRNRTLDEPNNPDGLSRGFFVWNSEVGKSAFGISTFLYRYVCGNHFVWGAENVTELRLVHRGNNSDKALSRLHAFVTEYENSSGLEEEAKIRRAYNREIGETKEQVLDAIFAKLRGSVSRKVLTSAYDSTEALYPVDGNPRTAFGIANGITRQSQELAYTDARVALDRAAGKLLEIEF